MKGYIKNIEQDALANANFRQVVYTGKHAQLVLMSIEPGEEIGSEVHDTVDQFFRIEHGSGKVVIDGAETPIEDGTAIIVPAGAEHNVINTSATDALKLYTIYSPAEHKDLVVHETKALALADSTDEFDGKTTE
jgi:mannose-6-phosphate isomerase-like protein (cupin superfamily)